MCLFWRPRGRLIRLEVRGFFLNKKCGKQADRQPDVNGPPLIDTCNTRGVDNGKLETEISDQIYFLK